LIPGTQWIDWKLNGSGGGAPHPAGSGAFGEVNPARYSIGFNLPPTAINTSLSVDVLADNCADVYLNGTLFGSQSTIPNCLNTAHFTTVSTFSTTTGFNTGANTLRFDVTDGGVIAGLDFKATVTYTIP